MSWEEVFKNIAPGKQGKVVPSRGVLQFYFSGSWGPWSQHLVVESMVRAGGRLWLEREEAVLLRDFLLELLPLSKETP